MELIKYIILGIVQGITEPVPVSSSGHIMIIKTLIERFSSDLKIDFTTFAVITNAGSLLAIMIIFRKDIIDLFKGFFGYIKTKEDKYKIDYKYSLLVVLATIPAGIAGLIVTKLGLLDVLEENIKFLGCMLLLTALFLFMIKDFKGTKDKSNLKVKDALVVGLFQMVALIPGISRSGSTIVGGMFSGLKREVAFTFSFILYIPISIATTALGIKDLLESHLSATIWMYYILGTIMAFIFTYIATKWFSKIVREGKLVYFSIYCLVVGLFVILFL